MTNLNKGWNLDEINTVLECLNKKYDIDEIARIVQRNRNSVNLCIHRIRTKKHRLFNRVKKLDSYKVWIGEIKNEPILLPAFEQYTLPVDNDLSYIDETPSTDCAKDAEIFELKRQNQRLMEYIVNHLVLENSNA